MNCLYYIVKLADEEKRVTGPHKESVVIDQLKGGVVAWTDIGWSPHQKEPWRRLYEFQEFQSILPPLPAAGELEKLTSTCLSTRGDVTKSESFLKPPVYLHVIGSEHGPFSLTEVRDLLQKGRFTDQVYIWCKGLQFWVPVQEIPEFSHLRFAKSAMTKTRNDVFSNAVSNQEGRAASREGMVCTARIRALAGTTPSFGVCLDVSASGLQVRLENHLPLAKGADVELELIPLSLLKLPSLKCKAKIAWYKQDSLCFGAQFISFERDGWEKLKNHFK